MQPQTWVSHSSISEYLRCPRAYFLKNVYKDPKTGRKINIINPALALGNVVHEVLESLAPLRVEERFKEPLLPLFNKAWIKIKGEAGGFTNEQEEMEFKNRGEMMIQRVLDNPGPLLNKAVKLHSPDMLPPRFFLSEKENIILCGKVDWIEYIPEDDSVHIIDFKTGMNEENPNSLQLPIYSLLVKNCQKRNVKKISYWYLETDNSPKEMPMPDLDIAEKSVLKIALQIKQLRSIGAYKCATTGGCFACRPLEAIVEGKAKFIRTSDYQDIYALL